METLQVLIVTFNDAKRVGDCLRALKQASRDYHLRVTMIDNGSKDESVRVALEAWPEAELIQTGADLGYAGGNNAALKKLRQTGWPVKAVLILNPDANIAAGAIDQMVENLFSAADIGAVGPQAFESGSTDEPLRMRSLWGRPYKVGFRGRMDAVEVDRLHGCCMLVRPRVFDQVGLFDEEYFLYWDEIDFCARMRAKGWRLVLLPHLSVFHRYGQAERPHTVYYTMRNQFLFATKNLAVLPRLLFLGKRLFWSTPRDFIRYVRLRRKDLMKAAIEGFWAGVRGKKGASPNYF